MVLSSGCGPQIEWRSALGVSLAAEPTYDGWLSPEVTDKMLESLLDALTPLGFEESKSRDCLSKETLVPYPGPIPCQYPNGCQGLQDGPNLHIAKVDCPWASAVRHESAHWLQACARGEFDPLHKISEVWDAADSFVPCP